MIGDNSHKRLIRQISIINVFLETHTHHFKIKGTHVENNLMKIRTFLLKQKKKISKFAYLRLFFLPITLPAGLWEMFVNVCISLMSPPNLCFHHNNERNKCSHFPKVYHFQEKHTSSSEINECSLAGR